MNRFDKSRDVSKKPTVKNEKDAMRKITHCLDFIFNHTSISYTRTSFKPHHFSRLMEVIAKYPEIDTLSFRKVPLGGDKAKMLSEYVGNSTSLKTLILSGNRVCNTGAKHIFMGVIKGGSLSSFEITHNQIASEPERIIKEEINDMPANVITNCKSLKRLDIGDCKLSHRGLKLLADAIKESTSLEFFGFSGFKCTNNTGKVLLKAIEENKSIRELDLRNREVPIDYYPSIINIIKTKGLHFINLGGAFINDFNVSKDLLEAIENSTTLTDVIIGRCGFQDNIAPFVLNIIKKNSNIVRLDLSYNKFSQCKIEEFIKAMELNYKIKCLNLKSSVKINESGILSSSIIV